jgi:MFS family permease
VADTASRLGRSDHYKWIALSNTTLGMLSATVNASIVIIALPAIFRGIKLNPLTPGNVSYLLWMLMGYLVVSAVLVVTLGRLGDIYGRVRMYNVGFAVFALGALALPFDPLTGPAGAMWLIGFRVIQAVGGAMIMANSPAILTDAFPSDQRGMAMGINQVAGISGQFIGLILGGVLAAVDWRLVFIVSVPIGIGGTIWSYLSLREVGARTPARIDWLGNVLFGLGLIGILVGITYGLIPYGGHSMGWSNPLVLTGLFGGVALLIAFCITELHVKQPMFDLKLLRIRAFAAGNAATLLAGPARLPVQGHAAVVRHLPPAAHLRLRRLRAAVGQVVGQARGTGVRLRRAAGVGRGVRRAAPRADELQIRRLRRTDLRGRGGHGPVLGAQCGRDHEQRPGPAARRRVGHARHVPELRLRAIDRRVLLADDRRTGQHAAHHSDARADLARRAIRDRAPDRAGTPGLQPVRRVPRLQPGTPAAGPDRRAHAPAGRPGQRPDRQAVLPAVALRPVPSWPGDRVQHGDRDPGDRRGRIRDARRTVRAP